MSREAYDGLICLSDLRAANLLLSCSRNNSFPTGNMVSVLKDFYSKFDHTRYELFVHIMLSVLILSIKQQLLFLR